MTHPHDRPERFGSRRRQWLVWGIASGAAAIVGLVVCFASTFGIERLPVVAGIVGPRTAVTAMAAVLAVLAAVVALFSRRARPAAVCIAVALVICGASSAGVILSRTTGAKAAESASASDLRVLSWNTNGGLVSPRTVADAAARAEAEVVVLPEIDPSRFDDYVSAFADAGLRLRGYRASDSSQVVVFVATALGRYRPATAGPDPAKTVLLVPETPGLPTIVALHAAQPALTANADWKDDLRWVERECAKPDVVAVGDFNATVDSFGGARLGGCRDAATTMGAADVGTWPTVAPTWLAMPLDHMLTSAGWSPVRFTVVGDEDRSGARHRPIVAEFTHHGT